MRTNPATPFYSPFKNAPQQAQASKGADATLRPDDPHVRKMHKRSFGKEGAIRQLTRDPGTWRDWNQNNKTEVSYYFNSYWGNEFNQEQKEQARRSIESWSDVANLAFTENGGRAEGRLTFGIDRSVRTAYGMHPDGSSGGDTVYNPRFVERNTLTHEVGHALGLTHPGDYNGEKDDRQRVYVQDSKAHSIMSYYNAQSSGKRINGNPIAPMMDDISAIQYKYGANYQTRREDNTYGFNANAGRDYYSLRSPQDSANFCVWDGGGNDTLDFSGYGTDQVINLREGSFSDVGHGEGNVSIARGVTIENAIGGSGNDVLIGNDANNRLTGGKGGDQMRGAGGADTFFYNDTSDSSAQNPDEIMDFTSGTDKIDVTAMMKKAGLSSLSYVNALSGKAGEAHLAYDKNTGRGRVSIDTTGDGKANLLINTHAEVKAGDIVQASQLRPTPLRLPPAPIKPVTPVSGRPEIRPHFIFNKVTDSNVSNSRLLTDFISGKDKIDLRGVQKDANTHFSLVQAFTGRIGDTVVKLNPQTQRYFIAVDLTGDRKTDFLVRSTQLIRPGDVVTG